MLTKRLGIIVPSSNSVMEIDFYHNLPRDITLHVTRMYLDDTAVTGEEEMLNVHFPKALTELETAMPDAVVLGYSPKATLGGDYELELCRRINEVAKCPSVGVLAGVRKAVEKRQMQRLAVVSPYIDELNQGIKATLEANNIQVVGIYGLGLDRPDSIAMIEPAEIYRFAKEKVRNLYVDGLYLACTNLRAMEVHKELQEDLGLPVITSNQAVFEAALELLQA